MKKKLLVIMMTAMMLSVTACTQNTPKENDTQKEENTESTSIDNNENSGSDTTSEGGSSNGSSIEVDYDTTGMESYTDKDGNVYYYDRSCVPDWWEGKVEITEVGGLKCLTTVVEDPDNLLIFKKDSSWRVAENKEHYENGADYDGYLIERYVPEGWVIDYTKSTSYIKTLKNKDLGVEAEVRVNGRKDEYMYWYDTSTNTFKWRIKDENGKQQDVTEVPDYIDYTVQTYEQYKGYTYDYMKSAYLYPYLMVRTYADGRVYYDGLQIDDDEYGIISMLEEDALKMQSVGTYIDIDQQLGSYSIAENDVDYALFAYMYWHKSKKLNPDADFYWKKRVK